MERITYPHKSASASRPSAQWNEDDYDVLADGAVVGRIMNAAAHQTRSSRCRRLFNQRRPRAQQAYQLGPQSLSTCRVERLEATEVFW
jgi:hypothetical protein